MSQTPPPPAKSDTSEIIIGLDAGTSLIKAVAFARDGTQLAVAAVPNVYTQPYGAAAEQDMALTWQNTIATLRQLADKIPNLARRAVALAVTGQGDGTWLMDQDGQPAGPALLWLDGRAAGIAQTLRSRPEDKERYRLTGTGLAACQQGPQMLWLLAHRPEQMARARTAFHCKDYLYYCLTGIRAGTACEGCFTFGDFRNRQYSDQVIEILGLKKYRPLLPDMVDGSEQTHPLSPDAAQLLGLAAGMPVCLGFLDVPCCALGGGLYDPLDRPGFTIIGSTGIHLCLSYSAEDACLNPERTGYTVPFPVAGSQLQMQTNMAATLNIDWVVDLARDILAAAGIDRQRLEILDHYQDAIAKAPAGAVLYHPYILEAGERGPFTNVQARASFNGLTSKVKFPDLLRGVFEGLALASRHCYSAMDYQSSNHPITEIRLSGGAAKNPVFRQIYAAILGKKVRTTARGEAGAAGAAMMAAVALRHYDTMQDCASEWVTPYLGEREEVDPALQKIYEKIYQAYLATLPGVENLWQVQAASLENNEPAAKLASILA
ncbi:MAG: FGGY-family carbohydrate kinase [Candidatus Symbiobacter sp.]|nr:FGGY-family carbohydrate kinase [Candidatus Symbiobacter sp.]